MSIRLFRILAALAGILGVVLLGVYYSTVLIPPQLNSGPAVAQMSDLVLRYHDAVFLDAWLQGTGALLAVVFFVALVYLAGAMTRFAGWLTMIASAVLLTVGLSEGTFTFGAMQGAVLGDPQTSLVSTDLTTVYSHVFSTVPAPFLFLSLGAVLVNSRALPRVFGYLALALGIAFEVSGFIGLFGALSDAANGVSLLIQIGQELWIVAVAITLIVQSTRKTASPTPEQASANGLGLVMKGNKR